jgi:hypothetical protein
MRYEQNAVLTSLRRAQQFFDDHSPGLSALNPTARKALDDIVAQLTTLSVSQETGRRVGKGETARSHALRTALRQSHMLPIAQVAKYRLPAAPEFAALTQPGKDVSAHDLVSSALAMADAAAPHAQTFLDSGLSETFLDDLRVAANAVTESIRERDAQQARRTGATAGLAALERQGRVMLRILNALILAQIGTDAQLRREWTAAKTVHHKPGPSANAQSAESAGPTLVPASTPTATPAAVATAA